MPTLLASIEDAVIARIKTALTTSVRIVEDAPATWSKDMALRAMKALPAVYVAFTGGPTPNNGATLATINAGISVLVATGHASGHREQRRGDTHQIGAYELMETLVPLLHEFETDGGTLQFDGVHPVDVAQWDMEGLMLWEIGFALPRLAFTAKDDGTLEPFRIFHADYDVAPADGTFEASDDVTLPQ